MAVLSLKHEEELKVLAEKKTQELQNIQELRLAKLESIIQVKDKEILKLSEERQKLAADFQHNLSLLQQRDEDLEKYNSVVLEAKSELNRKNQLISDLRITIDRQNAKQKSNEELLDSERNKLQKRLDEQKRHILVYCRNKEETVSALPHLDIGFITSLKSLFYKNMNKSSVYFYYYYYYYYLHVLCYYIQYFYV